MHMPPAPTTKERVPPAEVRTTPAATTQMRAMPRCTTRKDEVLPGQHAEEWGMWASHTQKHSGAGGGQPERLGPWTVTHSSLRVLRRVTAF